jgi:gamma-glutamylcyclotransferase (GGCT)/AIG2-like uncharacterized protein YtfP
LQNLLIDVEYQDHVISERARIMKNRALEFLNLSKELSGYAVEGFTKEVVREMIEAAEELFKLLDEVEKNVLG